MDYIFASHHNIIHVDCQDMKGVDITGECSSTLDYFTEVKDASIDSKTNEELISMIVSENQEKAE